MTDTLRPFTLTVVLSARAQTGGGYHQAFTSLQMLTEQIPANIRIRVLDEKKTFSEGLNVLIKAGLLSAEDIEYVPKRFENFRDRVVVETGLFYRFVRWLLTLRGITVNSGPLARYLDASDTDLVYFATPTMSAAELQIKPYIWTIWDLCHLDSPEFPEVRTSGKFEAREAAILRNIRKAALVVVDSKKLEENVRLSYGITADKFVTIPFSPALGVRSETPGKAELPPSVASIRGKYLFYPAQLWTHKNHLRIAEAVSTLLSEGYDIHAVFVGKDHGAGNTLRKNISSLGVENNVHFLGYVDDFLIPELYKQSLALVMASYFGPTNIPPLEAISLDVPVIASTPHRDQLGDAALYFNPDSAEELVAAVKEIKKAETRKKLSAGGQNLLSSLQKHRSSGYQDLSRRIASLEKRLIR